MPAIDFHLLREQIPIQRILELLDFTPTSCRGSRWRGPCPIHGSSPHSRSFFVDLANNRYRCFVCHAHGRQLDLWMAVSGLGLHAAVEDLCHRLGQPIPQLPLANRRHP